MQYRILLETSVIVLVLLGASSRGDITNWQTGEVIPGTEEVTPGPGLQLEGWETDDRNLRFADFAGANLRGAQFMYAWLDDARFTQADLAGAIFEGTSLKRTDFSGANLRSALLEGELTDADFSGANLRSALLEGQLTDADLSGADLTAARVWAAQRSGNMPTTVGDAI